MDDSQAALQALIDDIEALGWDFPEQLDVLEDAPTDQEAFALIYWQADSPTRSLEYLWIPASPSTLVSSLTHIDEIDLYLCPFLGSGVFE
jgi:hypothetical protein